MSGVTEVVNKALTLIGANRITSLTDGSTNAVAAEDIYEELRDELLRSHPWNFATKRVQLSQSSTDPTFEFDHAYPLPSDWLRTISVHHSDHGYGAVLYRSEFNANQRSIITSSDQIFLRYIYQATDMNEAPPDFRAALSYALARDLAVKLASSNSLRREMAREFTRSIGKARSNDAMGAFPELRPRGSWASSRSGRRRRDFFSDR